jgi:streptomycin 6-kinase
MKGSDVENGKGLHLPPEFIDKVQRIFGKSGREWLPGLPAIVAQCREQWGLGEGVMCPTVSMNYIEFTTTAAGEPVALKVGVPHEELFTEMEALRLYNGRGAARLLDADCDLGAILIQRLQPGRMLWRLGDNCRETEIAASIMRVLPVPPPETHSLPTFGRWVERAFRLTRTEWDPDERMPRDLIDRAEQAFHEIERDSPGDVVLHGDLHHENILLDDESGWTAIDPKGVIGAPCLEVGRFLQNQLPSSLPAERREALVRERVQILSAELGHSQETVAASALVDCVLSHCWSFEDEGISADWYKGIELARLLCRMIGL